MSKLIDMSNWILKNHGVTNSRLTVLKRDIKYTHEAQWICKCECGNIISARGSMLRNGTILSCGCYRKEQAGERGAKYGIDLTGRRFGSLVVLEKTNERHKRHIVWKCQCDCGNIKYAYSASLLRGKTTSCGCKRRSYGAGQIKEILDKNNIKYIEDVEYFKDLIMPRGGIGRYDFIILNNCNFPTRLIEFDSELHFRPIDYFGGEEGLHKQQEYDRIKNKYTWSHNIPIVRIPYTEKNITLDTIMGDQYLVRPSQETGDEN